MARLGYQEVIAIANEPGTLYRDIFQSEPVPATWEGVPIRLIQPDIDPAKVGADFTDMTEEGMDAVYKHGEEKGRAFVAQWKG